MNKNRRTSYAFAESTYASAQPNEWENWDRTSKAAFGINGAAKFAQIKEGTSNTMFMCESPVHKAASASFGPFWGQWVYTSSIVPAYGINVRYSGTPYVYAFRAGSLHPGGMNILLGDASVRFLSETTNVSVITALVSIRGGEILPEF
jgi:prepilin-type processing-associated H-X9-DG protein